MFLTPGRLCVPSIAVGCVRPISCVIQQQRLVLDITTCFFCVVRLGAGENMAGRLALAISQQPTSYVYYGRNSSSTGPTTLRHTKPSARLSDRAEMNSELVHKLVEVHFRVFGESNFLR